MEISRHYLNIGGRTVHYRRCGEGPPLLMIHQSPRSSAEYEALMRDWGVHFTCIAPDTPGFGQSDPLPDADPEIGAFADAVVEFARALGIEQTAAYGFHSGGIILVTALKRHPELFTRLAIGGYAIWNAEEMAIFGERYLPPFLPSDYGEHLVWLWNRILEQSWFFPWFDIRDAARLPGAHADPAKVHAIVMEMLDSGDAYRLGYGAVLRAPRDIPAADAKTPPVLISAYDGDPLQAHIDRLGAMPEGWQAAKVASPKAHQDLSLDFLLAHRGPEMKAFAADRDRGFLNVSTPEFEGLIHWRHFGSGISLIIHAPGRSLELLLGLAGFAIDLPGHGLSAPWPDHPPNDWGAWQRVIDQCAANLGATEVHYESYAAGDPEKLFPDLAPDRFGHYLTKAWSIVRAGHFFVPWYEAAHDTALSFDPASLDPTLLAIEHRALLRANAARAYAFARKGI